MSDGIKDFIKVLQDLLIGKPQNSNALQIEIFCPEVIVGNLVRG